MGNNPAVGGLVVRTEKPVYLPGETVNGTIYLNLVAPWQGTLLTLKIKGKEDTKWITKHTHYEGQGQHRRAVTITKTHLGHNPFINYKLPIFNWNQGVVPPGQYCLPFSVTLPPKIPGSFSEIITNRGYAKIVYKLKAELNSLNGATPPIKGEAPLYIREFVTGVTGMVGDTHVPLTTWCCCDQGVAHIRAYVEKSAYTPGEMANVICEVDNSKSNLPIKTIRCTLMWTLKVSNSKTSYSTSGAMADQIMGGMDAGGESAGVAKRVFSLPVSAHKNHMGDDQGTTHGRLVQMSYHLQIFADMDGCTCCDAEPMIQVPITIYFPTPVIPQVQAPSNWSPQSMQTAHIVLAQEYEYQSRKVGKFVEEYDGDDEPFHGQPGMNQGGGMPMQGGMQGSMGMQPTPGGGMHMSVHTNQTYGSPQHMGGSPQMPMQQYPMNQQQQNPNMMVQYPQQGGNQYNPQMGQQQGYNQNQMNPQYNNGMNQQQYNNGMNPQYNQMGGQPPQMMQTQMVQPNGYYGQR